MPLSTGQAVDKYRTLGLAIEAAVSMDRWDEVDTLLNERDGVLNLFAAGTPSIDEQSHTQLKACDIRLLEFLTGTRDQAAAGIRNFQEGTQMRRAYRSNHASTATLDRAG